MTAVKVAQIKIQEVEKKVEREPSETIQERVRPLPSAPPKARGRKLPPASAAVLPSHAMQIRVRVLLIEDDPFQALAYQRGLMEGGAEVDLASTAAEGLHLAANKRYDLIVTDLGLPDMEGLELCRVFKVRNSRTPILLISANEEARSVVEALRIGVEDFLIKPISGADLEARVLRLAERRRIQDEAGRRTVLAIGAHPDDQEIGVGGTLLSHARQGDRVVLLTLTGGEAGGETSTRAHEARQAANLLGAKLILGSLNDTQVPEGNPTIGLIEDAIRQYRPDIVYTHTRHDNHQDHRAVYQATMVAARSVSQIYCYQSPSTTPDFRPSRYIGIDNLISVKQRLISAYNSQAAKRAYLEPELIHATARYWGRFAEYGVVEPLEVARERQATRAQEP